MSDLYKYRVWCETESTWVYTDYREAVPTVCPNNNGHTIDTDKTSIVDKIPEQEERAVDGKVMTQPTPRKRGTKTKFIGVEDYAYNASYTGGGGQEFKFHHQEGDAMSHDLIIDANMIPEYNESWLHSSKLICLGARNDDISVHFIPRVVDFGVVGVNTAEFSGTGLNDLTAGGTYSGSTSKDFRIAIDATGTPDTFKWSNDGGDTWSTTGVAITGSAQTLEEGVEVTFAATTGHTLDDQWRVKAVKSDPDYRNYNNYLVVPSALGSDYGALIDIFNDITSPHLISGFGGIDYGALLYVPDKEDSETGQMKAPTGCFWDATFDLDNFVYENVTANYTGLGRYNMFTYPVPLPGTMFIEKMGLLGDNIIDLGSHDIEQLGHGVRMVVTLNTQAPDHEWWACFHLAVYRKRI